MLDEIGIKRILHITKFRFQRHRDETNGVEHLFSLLEERAGLKVVDYNFRTGILILEDRKGRQEHVFFGKMKEMLELIFDSDQLPFNNSSYNKLMKNSIIRMMKTFKKNPKTGQITILHEDGSIKQQFETLEDWHFAERVKEELRDFDRELRAIRKLRRSLSHKK